MGKVRQAKRHAKMSTKERSKNPKNRKKWKSKKNFFSL